MINHRIKTISQNFSSRVRLYKAVLSEIVYLMDNLTLIFQTDLDSDEQIQWAGRPRQGVFLKPSDALIIPFSIMWASFSIFWEYSVFQQYQTGKPVLFMAFWGVPFVLVGIYILILRFFFDAYLRSKTI